MSKTAPDEEHVREMFANFGLAYYHSEAMCRGIAIFYALMSFRDSTDATKPRIEEKMVEAFGLTLGQVIGKVKPFVSSDLQARLDQALDKRNFLAHAFWYERAYAMMSKDGLINLILELREYQKLFNDINDLITAITLKRGEEMGITAELVAEQFQKGLAGEEEPPLPTKKPLGKAIVRIVKVYDVPTSNGTTLVFMTDNHHFLQLSDVGLGWSNFSEVGKEWIPNPILSPYLPASITPRPTVTSPWNYEFKLPKNAALWVKKGAAEKTFRWGLRSSTGKKDGS